jgi:plastocyanin
MNRLLPTTGMQLYLLFFIMFFVGCSTPEERVQHDSNAVKASAPVAAIAENKADTVKIKQMKFEPAVLTVAAGTTIVFINEDMVTHDVTEETTRAWASGLLPPSKSWSMVADKTANYFCSIHVVMKGKIVVE